MQKREVLGEGVKTNLIIAVDVLVESVSAEQFELNNPFFLMLQQEYRGREKFGQVCVTGFRPSRH